MTTTTATLIHELEAYLNRFDIDPGDAAKAARVIAEMILAGPEAIMAAMKSDDEIVRGLALVAGMMVGRVLGLIP
jgi:hypothetical protein